MTELEKKAIDVIRNHSHKLIDKFTQEDLENREISIFMAGYHEGNKANEWHYVKDGDLPKEEDLEMQVLCFTYDGYQLLSLFSDPKPIFKVYGVIAWCEIPKYTEE